MSDFDPEWIFCHTGTELPCDTRAVVVLVVDHGSFRADIGWYYGKVNGWKKQFYKDAPVIAWTNLPPYDDGVEVIEHDED